MSTIWALYHKENKHTLYRGKDCIKMFCSSLKEHAKNIIVLEKKKLLPLKKEQLKSNQDANVCCICGKKFLKKLSRSKNYQNVRDYYYYAGKYKDPVHSICNLKFNVPNEIPVVFHNSSNYDYYYIIKKLANEFEGKCDCL